MLVEQLGQGGGRPTGLGGQHVGGLARRGQPNGRSSLAAQACCRRTEHRRLAGAGGTDDKHELLVPAHRLGGGCLRIFAGERDRADSRSCPGQQPRLLVQHDRRAEAAVGDLLAQGPTVPPAGSAGGRGWVQLDAAGGGGLGQEVDEAHSFSGGTGRLSGKEGGDLPGQVGPQPGRGGRGHGLEGLGDHGVDVHGNASRQRTMAIG